jgi:hypothetical protein
LKKKSGASTSTSTSTSTFRFWVQPSRQKHIGAYCPFPTTTSTAQTLKSDAPIKLQEIELHATSPRHEMSTQDAATELTNPVADPRIVDKLAEWLLEKKPWAYTGHKSTRSNAKPKELWVRFHKDTEVWWFEHFRYSTEPATDAGAKGPAYSLFRDALPDALRLFRARKEGKPLEEIPPVEYLYRKGECTKDGQPAVRAVKGFGRLPPNAPSTASAADVLDEVGAAGDSPYVDEPTLVCADLDRCPPYETSSEGMEPDYSELYVEKALANAEGTKRTYNCSKCKRPKKTGCICKTTSEAKEKIADAPDEAAEASVQATGPTGLPVKKRKRSSVPADERRKRSKA